MPSQADIAYSLEILALELGDEFGESFAVSLDADGFEDLSDILLGRRRVSTEGKKKVCCEVLHFES